MKLHCVGVQREGEMNNGARVRRVGLLPISPADTGGCFVVCKTLAKI